MAQIRTPVFKVVVAGAGGVGKTSMLHRYQTGNFTSPKVTIGIDFVTSVIERDNQKMILSVWDFSGEERFKSLFPEFCKETHGCFAVFDLTRPESLNDLHNWIKILYEKNGVIPVVLLGTKADNVSKEQLEFISEKANKFVTDHKLQGFITTSAKSGYQIKDIFDSLVAQLQN